MKILAIIFIFTCHLKFMEAYYPNRTVEFSIIISRNKTGHWFSDISLDRITPNLPNNWEFNIRHKITENVKNLSYNMLGTLNVLPPQPSDYELFPGIGYYKFHHDVRANSFNEAVDICAREGGHLMIINSDDEANVIRTLFERKSAALEWAYIGLDGHTKDGRWFTILGDPLATTGYTKWLPDKPDLREETSWCGSVHRSGLISNSACQENWPFFCEYDLLWLPSWKEIN